jgi:hypothetical protein
VTVGGIVVFKRILISAVSATLLAGTAPAQMLLENDFNGPALGSPGAVGNGFGIVYGGAYVGGGDAVVGTGFYTDQNIFSFDTFDPAGTTLSWIVDGRPGAGAAGVAVGWAQSGIYTCAGCGPEIWLEARNDRIVFDVYGDNGFARYYSSGPIGGSGPIKITMSLTNIGYTWSMTDNGDSRSASGNWFDGFGVSNVINAAGGNLSTFAATRSDAAGFDFGYFDRVGVSAFVPEPASWALMVGGFGLVGGALRTRRAAKPVPAAR